MVGCRNGLEHSRSPNRARWREARKRGVLGTESNRQTRQQQGATSESPSCRHVGAWRSGADGHCARRGRSGCSVRNGTRRGVRHENGQRSRSRPRQPTRAAQHPALVSGQGGPSACVRSAGKVGRALWTSGATRVGLHSLRAQGVQPESVSWSRRELSWVAGPVECADGGGGCAVGEAAQTRVRLTAMRAITGSSRSIGISSPCLRKHAR